MRLIQFILNALIETGRLSLKTQATLMGYIAGVEQYIQENA